MKLCPVANEKYFTKAKWPEEPWLHWVQKANEQEKGTRERTGKRLFVFIFALKEAKEPLQQLGPLISSSFCIMVMWSQCWGNVLVSQLGSDIYSYLTYIVTCIVTTYTYISFNVSTSQVETLEVKSPKSVLLLRTLLHDYIYIYIYIVLVLILVSTLFINWYFHMFENLMQSVKINAAR